VYVAFGAKAQAEAKQSAATLRQHNDLAIHTLTSSSAHIDLTTEQSAHLTKTKMFWLTPYSQTLMLDADTRIKGNLDIGFKLLHDGWDMVMVPSTPPNMFAELWSLPENDRQYTKQCVGYLSRLMLNTGVVFFNKTDRVEALFQQWCEEWLTFKDRDQGAFLRALIKCPVRLSLLGYPYNSAGGDIVDHLFGRARA
jgi:lipopolysaccharide biosynthesis glycosyltransferase